jgi:hypothetical protein
MKCSVQEIKETWFNDEFFDAVEFMHVQQEIDRRALEEQ